MKTTAVKSAAMFSASSRMDAPFYLNDAVAYYAGLEKCPYELTTVGESAKDVFFGNIFSRCFVKDAEHGVPYLRASEIQKADLDSGGLFLSKKQAHQLDYLRLKRDWILVTCSGTLGKCVYADARYEEFIGTHDLIRIIPGGGRILPGVLYSFLASKFGFATLTHSQYGSVILHTNPDQVRTIQIPVFPEEVQKRVNRLVLDSAHLREEADAARREAVGYFAHYDVEKQPTCFSKRLSKIGFSFAAYNNNLDVDAIRAKYADDSATIDELSNGIFLPPLFKHIYLDHDNGHPFFTGREITFQNQRPYRWLSPLGVKDIDDYTVTKGTLLVYKSGVIDGGMYGDVRIVDDDLDGASLSNHVARITPKTFAEGCWMYAFLKSSAGFKLLQSLAIGTAIPEMTPKHIATVRIPRPNRDLGKIERLVSEYISKRVKSNNMENEAIGLVESEIARWQEGGV